MAFQPSERAVNVSEIYLPHEQGVTLCPTDYGFFIGGVLVERLRADGSRATVRIHAPEGVNIVRAKYAEDTYMEPTNETGRYSSLTLGLHRRGDLPLEVDTRTFIGEELTVRYDGGTRTDRRDVVIGNFTVETQYDEEARVIHTYEELMDLKQLLGIEN